MESLRDRTINHYKNSIAIVEQLLQLGDGLWRMPYAEGKWTVAEIIGHFIPWDDFVCRSRIPYFTDSTIMPGSPGAVQMNTDASMEARECSKEDTILRFIEGRTKMIHLLESFDEHLWIARVRIGNEELSVFDYFQGLIQHDLHHYKQIRTALAGREGKSVKTEKTEIAIRLDHYGELYEEKVKGYHLPEEQLKYTALPQNAIQMAAEKKNVFPIVIFEQNDIVGFFNLHDNEQVMEHTDNRKAILLMAFSIRDSAQGRGIAKKAMKAAKEFVAREFPGKNEIVLGVNHRNAAAQKVYEFAGYKDTGRRKSGPNGEILILSAAL
ncbi:GNAT family N-acetyltransferase [Bacillus sp. 1P06AnD]|uniref:GNAT family N-acetyltransferase n=1 Tax=Bacillus sp. 1P06AnD TaxID=3132208 RepID=UPI0039A32DF0